MRIIRYTDAAGNAARYGVLDGDEVRPIEGDIFGSFKAGGKAVPLSRVQQLPCATPTKVVAGGANYHGHLKEVGLPVPETPVFFLKPPTSVVGQDGQVVYWPETKQLEYEGELAIVVKGRMHRTPPHRVLENILGYTCVNDVTARDIQVIGGNLLHLCESKSFDTFCPIGPWIETELDTRKLDLALTINGKVRQTTNTSDMIFPVEQMVSYFSHVMTLLPGDLILTGTPQGIGQMQVGDHVEVAIEGIGTLRHTVVAGGE
jgi:2-keto-4-pentenoate hydratase/2-oxohepta-3-ene-1,7-dioic acid hydratase in catechol pathway